MVASVEDRLTELEYEVESLADRLAAVERMREPAATPLPTPRAVATVEAPARAPAPPRAPLPDPSPAPVAAAAPPPRASRDLEELLGGRLLALVGAFTVLVGLLFLVALALDRGWLDERARIALALVGSGGLLVGGSWLHERRGRTQASLAAVGTGIAGLYLTLSAATSIYALVPAAVSLAGALAVGVVASALAVRWNSRTVAGIGICGALVSPVLVGAAETGTGIAFLAVAFAASTAVLVWKRWEWLRVGAFALAMFQLTGWVLTSAPGLEASVGALSLFGVLGVAAALGYELRVPARGLRPSTSFLVAANALVTGGVGYLALAPDHGLEGVGLWMAGIALAHLVAGIASLRLRGIGRDVSLLLLGVALASADLAFAMLVEGPALAVGWAVSAVVLALITRAVRAEGDLAQATLAGQLALAITHTLVFDAPPEALAIGGTVAWAPLAAIGVSAFTCARLSRDGDGLWRHLADGVALLTLAYTSALALDGLPLIAAWVGESLVLAEIARRRREPLAAVGSLGFLSLAGAHALAFEAPPESLVHGVASFPIAALALGAVAAAAAALAWRGLGLWRDERLTLAIAAALGGAYLASVGIVDAFQPHAVAFESGVGLGVRQQGQALLSAFWSALGLALLWAGLRRDFRIARLAGFGLLGVAVGKVFLYDMSALDSGYRVLSFIILGLLLLAGAYAYQRLRDAERPLAQG